MFNQKKWFLLFAMLFFGLAVKAMAPELFTRTASAEAQEMFARTSAETQEVVETTATVTVIGMTEQTDTLSAVNSQDIWKSVYRELMYETEVSSQKLAAFALAGVKERDLELMTSATDHIVNYHGRRFAITDDEYQVLLRIVEAEAPDEDLVGKMLVANVVLNRLEIGFGGDTISEVVFAKGQFEPVSNGRIFTVTPSETTIEAVERVLDGEDWSQGALYFMARDKASKKGVRWFDQNLVFLFKHGGHEFFKEKE